MPLSKRKQSARFAARLAAAKRWNKSTNPVETVPPDNSISTQAGVQFEEEERNYENNNEAPGIICVLCCRQTNHKMDDQLVKFFLEHVLPPRDENLGKFLEEGWIRFCRSCFNLVNRGRRLVEQIGQLEREVEGVKSRLRKIVCDSVLIKEEELGEEEEDEEKKIRMNLYHDIRQQLVNVNDFECENYDRESVWRGDGRIKQENEDDFGVDPLEGDVISMALSRMTDEASSSMEGEKGKGETPNEPSPFLEDKIDFEDLQRNKVLSTYSKKTPKSLIIPSPGNLFKEETEVIHKRRRKARPLSRQKGTKHNVSTSLNNFPMVDEYGEIIRILHGKSGEGKAPTLPMYAGTLEISSQESTSFSQVEIRQIPSGPLSRQMRRFYPCGVCDEKYKTLKDVILHRKFIHPGLAPCVSSVPSQECGQIFRSMDIKRHKIESHPILRCPNCIESFSTKERLVVHLEEVHFPPGSALPLPPIPEMGYDEDIKYWVTPLTQEEILEASGGKGKGSFLVQLERLPPPPLSPPPSFDQTDEINELLPTESGICDEKLDPETTTADSAPPPKDPTPTSKEKDKEFSAEIAEALLLDPPPPPPKAKKPKKILYNCGVCSTKFLTQPDLLQHLSDAHDSKPQFACVICHLKFPSLTDCELHVLAEHPKKPVIVKKSMKRKATSHTSTAPTTSTKSSTPADNTPTLAPLTNPPPPLGLEMNSSKHLKTWPFLCKVCRLRFTDLPVLQDHLKSELHSFMLEHGRVKVCPEKGCRFEYRQAFELTSHKAVSHRHPRRPKVSKCLDCLPVPRKFTDPGDLIRHRMRFHGFVPAEPVPFNYPCSACDKTFPHKARRDHHHLSHGINVKVRCPVCNKGFATNFKMREHVKYVHDKIPGKFVCDICNRRFVKSCNMRSHRLLHGEDRPWLCSECGKAFKTRTHLTIHNYGHDPSKRVKRDKAESMGASREGS